MESTPPPQHIATYARQRMLKINRNGFQAGIKKTHNFKGIGCALKSTDNRLTRVEKVADLRASIGFAAS
jgi:hypothetical protein